MEILHFGSAAPEFRLAADARWTPARTGWIEPDRLHSTGGKQIQLEDPDGNPIELFEPAS
jgi:hypothetical protein